MQQAEIIDLIRLLREATDRLEKYANAIFQSTDEAEIESVSKTYNSCLKLHEAIIDKLKEDAAG